MRVTQKVACLAAVLAVVAAAATTGEARAAQGDPDGYYVNCVQQAQLGPADEANIQSALGSLFGGNSSFPTYTDYPGNDLTFADLVFSPTYSISKKPFAGSHFFGTVSRTPCASDPTIFLCYSKFEVEPGVWRNSEAMKLEQQGYWLPFAVKGTSTRTRLGSYSLVCNLPAPLQTTGAMIDGAGNVVTDPAQTRYPVAG